MNIIGIQMEDMVYETRTDIYIKQKVASSYGNTIKSYCKYKWYWLAQILQYYDSSACRSTKFQSRGRIDGCVFSQWPSE